MSGKIEQPRLPLCPYCGGAVMMIHGRFQDKDNLWKPARFKCANCSSMFYETDVPELRRDWEEWVRDMANKREKTSS